MVYYGQGIGRYFGGNTSGQDALSNIGLPGVGNAPSIDAVPTYGAIVAYRRFWTPQVRTNVSYAYAHADFPSYALQFTPGSNSALFLNRDMQQVFVNLIWSPFGHVRDGVFGSGVARCRHRIPVHAARPVRRFGGGGLGGRRPRGRQPHRRGGGRPVLRDSA